MGDRDLQWFLWLFLFLCLSGAVGPALAGGIESTSHDMNFNNTAVGLVQDGGECSACHIPHNSSTSTGRLWPTSLGSPDNVRGVVAALCAYCHQALGGAGGPGDAESDNFVYHVNSHGYIMSAEYGVTVVQSLPPAHVDPGPTLPYTGDGGVTVGGGRNNDDAIDCTSCHDPHSNDSGRPFLRADIDILCAACHGKRLFQNDTDPTEGPSALLAADISRWGNTITGVGNPGSHPVGADITGDNYGGSTPITIPGQFEIAYGTTSQWSLGGHLSDGGNEGTGGIVCVTCHAVHGVQEDPEASGNGIDSRPPNANFLVVPQNTYQWTDYRPVANGNGARNYLCEACHQGADIDPAYGTVRLSRLTTTETGSWQPANPNPGHQAFSHPIDGMDPQTNMLWVHDFPSFWPSGDTSGTHIDLSGSNAMPTPICESCHTPHALAGGSVDRPDLAGHVQVASDTQYILRGTQSGVCNGCHHNPSTAGHHPVSDVYYRDQVTYLTGVPDMAGTDVTGCGTCHSLGGSSGQGMSHGWMSNPKEGFALDPSWIPYDNGRNQPNPQFATSLGQTCINCHNYSRTGTTYQSSPTSGDGIPEESAYAVLGDGSHFMGVFTTTRTAWPGLGQRFGFNAFADSWNSSNIGGISFSTGGGFSRFASTSSGYVLTCESCHELEPDKNAGDIKQLLLADYDEGDTANTHSWFCEACHVPPGTHPLWNQTVSRTGSTLNTSTSSDWLKIPGSGSDPLINDANPTMGNNIVSCDSCHQPHDAPTGSLTYILDAAEAHVNIGDSISAASAPQPFTNKVPRRNAGTGGWDYKDFCASCHPYN